MVRVAATIPAAFSSSSAPVPSVRALRSDSTPSAPSDAALVARRQPSLSSSAASSTPSRCACACSAHACASRASSAARASTAPSSTSTSLPAARRLRPRVSPRVFSISPSRVENGLASRAAAAAVSSAESSEGEDGGAAPSWSALEAAPRARPVSRIARRTTKSATRIATLASSLTFSTTLPCSRSSCERTPSTKLRASRASPSTSRSDCDLRFELALCDELSSELHHVPFCASAGVDSTLLRSTPANMFVSNESKAA